MLRDTTTLEPSESEWLHLLVGDWQLIADLSFADLVLWVRGGLDGWRAVAHVRPNTGPMVFYDDIVGRSSTRARASMLDQAARAQRIVSKPEPTMREDISIREDAVPVVPRRARHRRRHAPPEPHRRPHPEPARADLPRARRLADADGRGRRVPVGVGADRHAARRPAGRGRRHPPRRRRGGAVREPECRVGRAPDGSRRRRGRRGAGAGRRRRRVAQRPDHRRVARRRRHRPGGVAVGGRDAQRDGDAARHPDHRRPRAHRGDGAAA